MKLNKSKWLQELRRVEAELRTLKGQMRYPGHMSDWREYRRLFGLKAEATRLYMLRRVCKGRVHAVDSCWWLRLRDWDKAVVPNRLKFGDYLEWEKVIPLVLDGVPGWKEQFLEPEFEVSPLPDDRPQLLASN